MPQPAVSDRIEALRLLPTGEALRWLYELVVEGCDAANADQARAVLVELIASIDYQADEEIARGFHRLYSYCLEQVEAGKFKRVGFIFKDLRDRMGQVMAEETQAGEP
mgnify:CR=1 FL=1